MKRTLLLLSVLLSYSLVLHSQDSEPAADNVPSEVCEMRFGSNEASYAYLTAETDEQGRVIFTIKAYDDNEALTIWRANGMNPKGFKYDGDSMEVWFTRSPKNVAGVKQIIYTPRTDSVPVLGKKITFNRYSESANLEWKTAKNTNAYTASVSFSYTYGGTCVYLTTPVLTEVTDAGVPIFEAVEGADSYIVKIYLDGVLKHSQTIQPGGAISGFTPYVTAGYTVTVTAHAGGKVDSPASDPVVWQRTAVPVSVGNSELCNSRFGKDANSYAYLTWETDSLGDVNISISGDAGTNFRANGMSGADLAEFSVGKGLADAYFERVYSGDRSSLFTLHLRDTTKRPAIGEPITYSGTVAYRTSNNSNAYGNFTFRYTYGTRCPGLEAPEILSIDAGKHFHLAEEIEGADRYRITVWRGELLMLDVTLNNGDSIPFLPTATYTYTVYARAINSANHFTPSPESPAYLWYLPSEVPVSAIDRSTLCSKFVSSDDGGVTMTAETTEEGNIRFVLGGAAEAKWRGEGLKTSAMTICGKPVDDYFEKVTGFLQDTLMLLRLKPSAKGQFFKGDVITYNDHVEWQVQQNDTTWRSRWVLNFPFTWYYGTTCVVILPRLDTPVITEVTDEGVITFNAVSSAASYLVRVTDADRFQVMTHNILSGDTILRAQSILPYFDYNVALKARPAEGSTEYRESLWSDEVAWVPSWREMPQPDDEDEWGTPTGINEVEGNVSVKKIFINGQLYILVNEKVYNVLGQQVK
ncbi:MAG: hypothetical protein IJS13_03285 [Paludibacteraceae bacterium]|nr:hypothetical protein [Paludibacteraceae bacterium]